MEKTNSLESFMQIVETQYPHIEQYITSKKESAIELNIPYNHGKTWVENSSVISPLFDFPGIFPIKKSQVSFIEKYDYFKVSLELL